MHTSDRPKPPEEPPKEAQGAGVFLEPIALEISQHLVRQGHPDKASAVLSELIKTNLPGVSVKTVIALARIAYDSQGWESAAELWNLALAEAPNDTEALLKLSHCLVELGDMNKAEPFAHRLQSALHETASNPMVDDFNPCLEQIFKRIYSHYAEGRHQTCDQLLRILEISRLPKCYTSAVLGEDSGSSAPSEEEIHRLIERAFARWHSSPAFLEKEPLPIVPREEFRRLKVFLVFRQFFLGGSVSREHELTVFLRESAKAMGLEAVFLPAVPFQLPERITAEQQYWYLDNVIRALMAVKPDLVVFDDLCTRKDTPPYVGREVFRNVLTELKEKIGFKLIAYYPDPWVSENLEAIEFVCQFADLVWHQNVALARRASEGHAKKLFPAPIPYLENVFCPPHTTKDIGACFLGSIYSYNYLRAIWYTVIRRRNIPCQLFVATHMKGACPAGDTIEDYGTFMSRVRIMVNFSARNPSTRIMTGRAWESILAKALLLEEENDEITNYFVPFVHFIPFRSATQLEAYIHFFERHEDIRRRIVDEAYAWFQRRFSKKRVWHSLIDAALRGTPSNLTIPTAEADRLKASSL